MPKDPKMALIIAARNKPDDGYGPLQSEKGRPDMGDDYEGVRFKAPEGMDLEGKKEGDTMEMVGTFQVEPNGMLCLKKVDGMDLGEKGEKGDADMDSDDKGTFTESVMGGPPEGGEGEQEGM